MEYVLGFDKYNINLTNLIGELTYFVLDAKDIEVREAFLILISFLLDFTVIFNSYVLSFSLSPSLFPFLAFPHLSLPPVCLWCECSSVSDREECWIPWNWSYSHLWIPDMHWELMLGPLEEQHMLLTISYLPSPDNLSFKAIFPHFKIFIYLFLADLMVESRPWAC